MGVHRHRWGSAGITGGLQPSTEDFQGFKAMLDISEVCRLELMGIYRHFWGSADQS